MIATLKNGKKKMHFYSKNRVRLSPVEDRAIKSYLSKGEPLEIYSQEKKDLLFALITILLCNTHDAEGKFTSLYFGDDLMFITYNKFQQGDTVEVQASLYRKHMGFLPVMMFNYIGIPTIVLTIFKKFARIME